MPRKPRYEVADSARAQVFHAIQWCVFDGRSCAAMIR